jgi:hypothetical protein
LVVMDSLDVMFSVGDGMRSVSMGGLVTLINRATGKMCVCGYDPNDYQLLADHCSTINPFGNIHWMVKRK